MNTRRGFMKAAAAGGLAYAFGRTAGTVHAQAVGVGGFNDYKALVCVFLAGGNDCWNMVVPTSTAEYNAYSPDHFPGSAKWNRWNQAVKALEAFDAAHPELVAELKSEAEADRKAKYDALSDFVKNGS